jgi:hypothetical protein
VHDARVACVRVAARLQARVRDDDPRRERGDDPYDDD